MKLWRGKSFKKLTKSIKKSGGRNFKGRITTRHFGGGHSYRTRIVDFDRSTFNTQPSWIKRFEYAPGRTGTLALLVYKEGSISYVLASNGLKLGQMIGNGINFDTLPGNSLPLTHVPPGTIMHSVNFRPGSKSGVARAGGTFVQMLRRYNDRYSLMKIPSGEKRLFQSELWGTIGTVMPVNVLKKQIKFKAGANRWRGIRPSVRGVAMNPVDHPHGGGQGKTSGGRPSVSPWARLTKGFVTKPKRFTKSIVYRHRKDV